jgi:hypothetical protein
VEGADASSRPDLDGARRPATRTAVAERFQDDPEGLGLTALGGRGLERNVLLDLVVPGHFHAELTVLRRE